MLFIQSGEREIILWNSLYESSLNLRQLMRYCMIIFLLI